MLKFCTQFYTYSISRFGLATFQMLTSHLGLVIPMLDSHIQLFWSTHTQAAQGHPQGRTRSHLFTKGTHITTTSLREVCDSLPDPTWCLTLIVLDQHL